MCITMRRAKPCGWLVLKLWNESRTNRGRIADSQPVGIRSRLYLDMTTHSHTIGGAAATASAAKWLRSRCSELSLRQRTGNYGGTSLDAAPDLTDGALHCVRAFARLDCGTDTNCVACITPSPSGVGMEAR